MSPLVPVHRTSRWRRAALSGTTLCLLAGVALGAGLRVAGAEAGSVRLAAGVPTVVSPAQLTRYALASGRTVYWLGPIGDRRLEVTEAGAKGLFVRYLPAGAGPAGTADTFLTVASYPLDNAYRTAIRSSRAADAVSRRLGRGGVAVWRRSRPTNVYVAFPESDILVEIYDPGRVVSRGIGRASGVRPVA